VDPNTEVFFAAWKCHSDGLT